MFFHRELNIFDIDGLNKQSSEEPVSEAAESVVFRPHFGEPFPVMVDVRHINFSQYREVRAGVNADSEKFADERGDWR